MRIEERKIVPVHLQIYVVDQGGVAQALWRRTLYDFPYTPLGMRFLLRSRDRAQKWYFPDGGIATGEYFDADLDAYIVWIQVNQQADFEAFGFTPLHPERWD